MVLTKLVKVLVGLVDYDDGMFFGKFYNYSSSLLHPCRVLASITSIIFTMLFCLYQDDQLKEWYGLTAALPGGTLLEVPIFQFSISLDSCCGDTHHLYSSPSFS